MGAEPVDGAEYREIKTAVPDKEGDSTPTTTVDLIDPAGGDRSPPDDAHEGTTIRAHDVTKVFGAGRREVHGLGPLDLDIREGEFVCLVGPSGCGKSTFLRVVAGLHSPSSGAVQVKVSRGSAASPISMVFQDYGIFPWKTVAANVRLGLELAGVRRQEADERASEWIARLGLAGFEDHFPKTLSGGMQQRVAVARALATDPEILLMDEPFASLDAQLRELMQEELLRVWEADRRTVLFVTHSLDEAIVLGDRVVIMSARPGRVIADFKVPFDRPRSPALRGEAEFAALRERIWAKLRVEVNTALGKEEKDE